MKRLLKTAPPPDKVTVSYKDYKASAEAVANAEAEAKNREKNMLTFSDLVDIINQIEELSKYNAAIKKDDDGRVLLAVGDSVYQISEPREKSYPRRRLTKLDI